MLNSIPNVYALGLAAIFLAAVYIYRDVRWRRFSQHADLAQLKPSLFWGHMKALGERLREKPAGTHHDYVFAEIQQELGNPPMFNFDMRPLARPMVVIANHELAEQASRASKTFPWSTHKSPSLHEISPLTGENSLLAKEGEEWKALRRRFNPGFAPKHLLSLLPCILDKTQYFIDHLDRLARSGDEFLFNELTTNLTFDIIGAVVLDVDLDAQRGKSELVNAFQAMTKTFLDPSPPGFARFFLRQRFIRWRLRQRMETVLRRYIIDCHEKQNQAQGSIGQSRSVLSLSLEGLETLDESLISMISDQMKTFLFAGHDTTSIALQWAMYELARTPRALAAIRAELDEIFGPDTNPATVRDQLLGPSREELYARLQYTSAVMKETLRLHPPAGSGRFAPKGSNFRFTMPDGQGMSPVMDNKILYLCHYLIQRDPTVYGETASVFEPERWLGNTDTSMAGGGDLNDAAPGLAGEKHAIPASAWRPFERGQRNCIGQELANIEMRVILACTVRRFDFEKVGLGELLRDEKGNFVMDTYGQYKTVNLLYNVSSHSSPLCNHDFVPANLQGQARISRANVISSQASKITAQPTDGCRMRVRLSDKAQAASRT